MEVGGKRNAPAALLPEKIPGSHCTEGGVGPIFGRSYSHRDSIPGPFCPEHIALPTTLPRPILSQIQNIFHIYFVPYNW
jgi:hypothetical protein